MIYVEAGGFIGAITTDIETRNKNEKKALERKLIETPFSLGKTGP